jgi:hypothetical protein
MWTRDEFMQETGDVMGAHRRRFPFDMLGHDVI